jgi:hypothetical protein
MFGKSSLLILIGFITAFFNLSIENDEGGYVRSG